MNSATETGVTLFAFTGVAVRSGIKASMTLVGKTTRPPGCPITGLMGNRADIR